jgi:hypothetical protein
MRPIVAWKAMKAAFTNELRIGTSTPIWVKKAHFSTWLVPTLEYPNPKLRKESYDIPISS